MITAALQSELSRFKYHGLSSIMQKLPELNLRTSICLLFLLSLRKISRFVLKSWYIAEFLMRFLVMISELEIQIIACYELGILFLIKNVSNSDLFSLAPGL